MIYNTCRQRVNIYVFHDWYYKCHLNALDTSLDISQRGISSLLSLEMIRTFSPIENDLIICKGLIKVSIMPHLFLSAMFCP